MLPATANRDGGGPATNGSKTEASSGPVPATATDNNGPNAAAPHTTATTRPAAGTEPAC